MPFVPAAGRVPGTGVYLRTDFWATITTGGSYGHTCYVARELARSSENLICFVGSRLGLLDDPGSGRSCSTLPQPMGRKNR